MNRKTAWTVEDPKRRLLETCKHSAPACWPCVVADMERQYPRIHMYRARVPTPVGKLSECCDLLTASIHDALWFPTREECEGWITANPAPVFVARSHMVCSPPAPSDTPPGTDCGEHGHSFTDCNDRFLAEQAEIAASPPSDTLRERVRDLEKGLTDAIRCIEEAVPNRHSPFCNEVHAENGACEGDYLTYRFVDSLRALLSPESASTPDNTTERKD